MRAALLAAALLLVAAAPAGAAPEPVKVGDFGAPVHVASPPGDPRLFVVEKAGLVKVAGGGTAADLTDDTESVGERGLLSIAFPPDHAATGLYYVFFTARSDGSLRVIELPTRRTLLNVPHPTYSNHNGGQLQFGPDGMLYAGTGDGGGSNDPFANAQDLGSPLGKILRLDPRSGAVEVFAYGLRNPWRFSFHGSDIVVGDVGQGAREEVDRITGPGMNFGWPCFEGSHPNVDCDAPGAVTPVLEQSHANGFCSITGGYVVRDPGLPTLVGRYLYGDFCNATLRSVSLDNPADDRAEPLSVPRLVSFGEDGSGRLYAVSLDGPVYRIQDSSAPPPPAPTAPALDRVAPRLSVRMRGVRRRHLRLRVRCDERCRVVARGRLRGAGRLKKAERELAGATRTTVKVRMNRKTARRLRRALRRRGRVIARFTVRATDPAGNESRVRRRARVRR